MSVESPRETPSGSYAGGYDYSDSRGDGWLLFAGVMLMILGILNFIGGIAAIDDANVYVANAQYTFADLNTWGWVILLTGAVQVIAALGIFSRNQFARWLGVGFAGLNAIAQLLMMPAFPLWSLAIFFTDVLIIYGLVAYGTREA